MELRKLLDNGPLEYYEEEQLSNLYGKVWHHILTEISEMDLLNEPLLNLVTDFARKRNLTFINYDENEVSCEVQVYCSRHTSRLRTKRSRVEYEERLRRFYNNKILIDSLKYWGLDPSSFWYLFLFCNYYSGELLKVEKKSRSIKGDLELLVARIRNMNFSNNNWESSYPLYNGILTLANGVDKEKISITTPQTIHLIGQLIDHFLKEKHNPETEQYLDNLQPKLTPDYMKYLYYNTKGDLTDEELKERNDSGCLDGLLEPNIIRSKVNKWQQIALLKYYVFGYLNNNSIKHSTLNDEERKKRLLLITDKNKLFALMLYVTGLIKPDNQSKKTLNDLNQWYNSGDYDNIRNYVWSCIKDYNIESEEMLKKTLEKLSLK